MGTVRDPPDDWWAAIDGEILSCLQRHGPMTPADLSQSVGISEGEAVALLAMLAREGKVRICQVELNGGGL